MRCITLLLSLALLGSCAGRTSETAAPAITGTATYRERMMLPPGAVLEVRLEDVSRADTAADLIASTTVTLSGGPPYSFSLAYPHDKINAKNRYALRGRITSEGGLMFTSDSGYPVLGPENIAKVDMVLRRVEAEASTAQLVNTYWKLMTLDGKASESHEGAREIHFVLHSEGNRVAGFSGCNQLMGAYKLDGDKITFEQMGGTLMACVSGMEIEREIHAMFPRVAVWKIAGETLQFTDSNGALIATFESRYMK